MTEEVCIWQSENLLWKRDVQSLLGHHRAYLCKRFQASIATFPLHTNLTSLESRFAKPIAPPVCLWDNLSLITTATACRPKERTNCLNSEYPLAYCDNRAWLWQGYLWHIVELEITSSEQMVSCLDVKETFPQQYKPINALN